MVPTGSLIDANGRKLIEVDLRDPEIPCATSMSEDL